MKVASIMDQDILSVARHEAIKLLESDPDLRLEENRALSELFDVYYEGVSAEMS